MQTIYSNLAFHKDYACEGGVNWQDKNNMENQIKYKLMNPGEEDIVINIVSTVFDEFVAPHYSEEGIIEFYKYANATTLAERSKENHFTVIAEQNNKPVAIIEIRNNNHISLFFTKTKFQRKGIGKQLFQHAIEVSLQNNPGTQKITVNSSPNATKAYEKMGFTIDDEEQCINGIKFVPMSLALNNKMSS